MVCNIFFCFEFPVIHGGEEEDKENWQMQIILFFQQKQQVESCEKFLEKVYLLKSMKILLRVGRAFVFVWKVLSDF